MFGVCGWWEWSLGRAGSYLAPSRRDGGLTGVVEVTGCRVATTFLHVCACACSRSNPAETIMFHEYRAVHETPSPILINTKTIGNRKGDCAWSCSRGQTQPEKICKSQRTNQCHSLRTFYWFVLCNLQIFSGCVCPLEQLHAQSPFLFPIVLVLIWFLFSVFPQYLLFLHPGCSGMCFCILLEPLRGRKSCCLWFWHVMHFEHSTAGAGSERVDAYAYA